MLKKSIGLEFSRQLVGWRGAGLRETSRFACEIGPVEAICAGTVEVVRVYERQFGAICEFGTDPKVTQRPLLTLAEKSKWNKGHRFWNQGFVF